MRSAVRLGDQSLEAIVEPELLDQSRTRGHRAPRLKRQLEGPGRDVAGVRPLHELCQQEVLAPAGAPRPGRPLRRRARLRQAARALRRARRTSASSRRLSGGKHRQRGQATPYLVAGAFEELLGEVVVELLGERAPRSGRRRQGAHVPRARSPQASRVLAVAAPRFAGQAGAAGRPPLRRARARTHPARPISRWTRRREVAHIGRSREVTRNRNFPLRSSARSSSSAAGCRRGTGSRRARSSARAAPENWREDRSRDAARLVGRGSRQPGARSRRAACRSCRRCATAAARSPGEHRYVAARLRHRHPNPAGLLEPLTREGRLAVAGRGDEEDRSRVGGARGRRAAGIDARSGVREVASPVVCLPTRRLPSAPHIRATRGKVREAVLLSRRLTPCRMSYKPARAIRARDGEPPRARCR